ncbi:Pumilio-like 5 [Vitis vinifera]|uniref:Pumilio-like 5 n=1 Tax=Vitis vinifera TaxID=29760 RepID=A0A438HNG9_VITVI|nr:Pumilio-like 5 [Vitis vinifera]
MVPNRSGSAPPSMEGSFAAIRNLMTPQNNLNSSLASLSSAIENSESEEQLRSDPAYFAYYCSNVNLNPRLPPPLISRENQRLEESEDDRSPCQTSDDWPETSSAVMPGQKTASSAGRHKSLVDLIQEDFPHTPSPVYNQSRSSSHAATEELLDLDVHAISLNDSSLEISKLPGPGPGTVDVSASTCTLDAPAIGLMPNKDDAANSFLSSSYSDRKHSSLPLPKDESSDKGGVGALVSEGAGLEVSRVESKTKASNVSILLVAENNANKQGQKPSYERNAPPHHPYAQQSSPYKVQGVRAQVISQGMSYPYNGMEKLPHALPKFSSVEVQPMMQSPGLTPPLLSALVPQFIGGYPTPAVIPMPFDATSGQQLMQYFQHPFEDAYGSRTEMDWYGILQVEQAADDAIIRKRYQKLALLLHPNKNKFVGAEAAFKLIGEENRILSDQGK